MGSKSWCHLLPHCQASPWAGDGLHLLGAAHPNELASHAERCMGAVGSHGCVHLLGLLLQCLVPVMLGCSTRQAVEALVRLLRGRCGGLQGHPTHQLQG
jgi:hypothetical protein